MSDENPVEEIKDRLKIDKEDVADAASDAADSAAQDGRDIAGEFRSLGQQFAETLQKALNSEERSRLEGDVREGMKIFADEVNKVVGGVRESTAGQRIRDNAATQRIREEASKLTGQIDGQDIGKKTRSGLAGGLRWLSDEMGKLADQFTPEDGANGEEEIIEIIVDDDVA